MFKIIILNHVSACIVGNYVVYAAGYFIDSSSSKRNVIFRYANALTFFNLCYSISDLSYYGTINAHVSKCFFFRQPIIKCYR